MPALSFINNGKNLWYCEANNIGAADARSPLVFILNNDLWLEPDCVELALKAAEEGKSLRALVLGAIRSLGITVTDADIKGKRGRRGA